MAPSNTKGDVLAVFRPALEKVWVLSLFRGLLQMAERLREEKPRA